MRMNDNGNATRAVELQNMLTKDALGLPRDFRTFSEHTTEKCGHILYVFILKAGEAGVDNL